MPLRLNLYWYCSAGNFSVKIIFVGKDPFTVLPIYRETEFIPSLDDLAPKHIPLLGINSVVPHYRDNSNMLNNSSMLGFGMNYIIRQQMSWYLAIIF